MPRSLPLLLLGLDPFAESSALRVREPSRFFLRSSVTTVLCRIRKVRLHGLFQAAFGPPTQSEVFPAISIYGPQTGATRASRPQRFIALVRHPFWTRSCKLFAILGRDWLVRAN